ncbi:unnamed protein product, partial [Rotaria magnacalcarata]
FKRPFVEFVSAPFWSVVSTRFRQAKNILLMALLSWIVFTLAIGLINPPPHSCWRDTNATHQSIERVGHRASTVNPNIKIHTKRSVVTLPMVSSKNSKLTTDIIDQGKTYISNQTNLLKQNFSTSTITRRIATTRRIKAIKTTTIKTTRLSNKNNGDDEDEDEDDSEDDDVEDNQEDNAINENQKTTTQSNQKQSDTNNVLHINTPKKTIGNPISITVTNLSLVKPLASSVLYEQKDVRNVFMVFLLLIIIGEFFSAPAITLADAYTLTCLAQDTEQYGRQRMYGSLGWGLAIFIVA